MGCAAGCSPGASLPAGAVAAGSLPVTSSSKGATEVFQREGSKREDNFATMSTQGTANSAASPHRPCRVASPVPGATTAEIDGDALGTAVIAGERRARFPQLGTVWFFGAGRFQV